MIKVGVKLGSVSQLPGWLCVRRSVRGLSSLSSTMKSLCGPSLWTKDCPAGTVFQRDRETER